MAVARTSKRIPLPLGVIRLDPPAVIAGSDGLDPASMLEVPAHGVTQALVETVSLQPAEIALELREVDRAALVVTGAVGDEPDEDGVGRSGLADLLGDGFRGADAPSRCSTAWSPRRRCRSFLRLRAS